VRTKAISLVLLNVHISSASPDLKVRDIRLDPIPMVAAKAYSARGTVVPSKNDVFESLMVAVKKVVLAGR